MREITGWVLAALMAGSWGTFAALWWIDRRLTRRARAAQFAQWIHAAAVQAGDVAEQIAYDAEFDRIARHLEDTP